MVSRGLESSTCLAHGELPSSAALLVSRPRPRHPDRCFVSGWRGTPSKRPGWVQEW